MGKDVIVLDIRRIIAFGAVNREVGVVGDISPELEDEREVERVGMEVDDCG